MAKKGVFLAVCLIVLALTVFLALKVLPPAVSTSSTTQQTSTTLAEVKNASEVIPLPQLPSEVVSGERQKDFWNARWVFNDSKVCSLFSDDLLKGLCLIEDAERNKCAECCNILLAKRFYTGTMMPYSVGENTAFITPYSSVNSSVFWSLCITGVAEKTGNANLCSKLEGDFTAYCKAYVTKDQNLCRLEDSFTTAKCYRTLQESTPPERVLKDAQGYGRLW